MLQHPIPITLSDTDRASLQTFIHAGKANARSFPRAHALLKAADGWTDAQICEAFGLSRNTSIQIRQRYLADGLEAVLYDKKQQSHRQAVTGEQAAHLIAVTCTPVPDGHDHWTLRLLAAKAVAFGVDLIFFNRRGVVFGGMDSTNPNSRAFPARNRNGPWAWPSGTRVPGTAWRWDCCFLSYKTASNPSARYRWRIWMEVLRERPNASQIWASVQPSAALSKACARVKLRALALPAWMKVCKEARSVSDKV